MRCLPPTIRSRRMTDPALDLLNTLFERWQRGDNTSKTLSLSLAGRDSGGYRATSGNCRESFHAVMANAASCGAVTLEWGRFEAEHELLRVLLVDGHKLADFLGRAPARTQVAALAPRITPLLDTHRRGCKPAGITRPPAGNGETLRYGCVYRNTPTTSSGYSKPCLLSASTNKRTSTYAVSAFRPQATPKQWNA